MILSYLSFSIGFAGSTLALAIKGRLKTSISFLVRHGEFERCDATSGLSCELHSLLMPDLWQVFDHLRCNEGPGFCCLNDGSYPRELNPSLSDDLLILDCES